MISIIIAGRTLDLRHPKSHSCLSSTFSKDEEALNGHLSDEEKGEEKRKQEATFPHMSPLSGRYGCVRAEEK